MQRHYKSCLALVLVLAALVPAHPIHAESIPLCFNVPGINNCIEGRFRQYWEQNGGLAVFGYPISFAQMQPASRGSMLTQYFERNRLELHPETAPPYDVLLGRLGDDRLQRQGRRWQAFPKAAEKAGCRYFSETGHNL